MMEENYNDITKYYRENFIPIDITGSRATAEIVEIDKVFNTSKYSQKLNFKTPGSRWVTVNDQSFFIYWEINYFEEEGLEYDCFDIFFLPPTSFNEQQFKENNLTVDIQPTKVNTHCSTIHSFSKIISEPQFFVIDNQISVLYLTEGNDLIQILFDKIDEDFQGKVKFTLERINAIINQQITAYHALSDNQIVIGTKTGNLFHISFDSPISDDRMVLTELKNQPLFQKLKSVFSSGHSNPVESITHCIIKEKEYIFTFSDDKLNVWTTKGFLQSIIIKKDAEAKANTVYSLRSVSYQNNLMIIALLTNIGHSSSISIFTCKLVKRELQITLSFTTRLKNSSVSDFALHNQSLGDFTYNHLLPSSSSIKVKNTVEKVILWVLGKDEQGDDFVKYISIDSSILFDEFLVERNQWNDLMLEENYHSHFDDEIAKSLEEGNTRETQEIYLNRIFTPNRFCKFVIAYSLIRFCESLNVNIESDDLNVHFNQLTFHQLKQLVVKYMQQISGNLDVIWPQLLSHCSAFSKEHFSPSSFSFQSNQSISLFTRHEGISLIVPCERYENVYFSYSNNEETMGNAEMELYKCACKLTSHLRPFSMLNYLEENNYSLKQFNFIDLIQDLTNSLLIGDFHYDPNDQTPNEALLMNPLLFHHLSSLLNFLDNNNNNHHNYDNHNSNNNQYMNGVTNDHDEETSPLPLQKIIKNLFEQFELEEVPIKQESPANYHPIIFKTALNSFTKISEIRMTIILKIAVLLGHLKNFDSKEQFISPLFCASALKKADDLLRKYYLMRWLSYQYLVDDNDNNEGAILDISLLDSFLLLSRQYLLQFNAVLPLTSSFLITSFHSVDNVYNRINSLEENDEINFNDMIDIDRPSSDHLSSIYQTSAENYNSVCHFLLKNNQYVLLFQLANYLLESSEEPILHYYLAFSYAHFNQFDKAIPSFEKSIPICDIEKYKKITDHFQQYSAYLHTIQITNIILSSLSPLLNAREGREGREGGVEFSTIEHFLRIIFNCSLEIGDYTESLKSISRLRSNLNHYFNKLITSLIKNNKLEILANFRPINRKSFSISKKILHEKAINQPIPNDVNYYSILYSLFLKQYQYYKAADVMMEYVDRINSADQLTAKEKCNLLRDNYLLAITALRSSDNPKLIDEYRWTVFRENEYCFISIAEMEKQFLLLNILLQFNRFDYMKAKNVEKKILSHLVVNNRFEMALAFGSKFKLDLSQCFRSIVQLYLDNLETNLEEMNEKLQDWLDTYDDRFTNFKYHSFVCDLIQQANQQIPDWLQPHQKLYPFHFLNEYPELLS